MLKEIGVEINGRIYYEDFVKMMGGTIGKRQRQVGRKLCHATAGVHIGFYLNTCKDSTLPSFL